MPNLCYLFPNAQRLKPDAVIFLMLLGPRLRGDDGKKAVTSAWGPVSQISTARYSFSNRRLPIGEKVLNLCVLCVSAVRTSF